MKILETVIFSLGVVFLLIGIHQAMMVGFKESYWLFMVCFLMLMAFQWVKSKSVEKQGNENPVVSGKKRNVKK